MSEQNLIQHLNEFHVESLSSNTIENIGKFEFNLVLTSYPQWSIGFDLIVLSDQEPSNVLERIRFQFQFHHLQTFNFVFTNKNKVNQLKVFLQDQFKNFSFTLIRKVLKIRWNEKELIFRPIFSQTCQDNRVIYDGLIAIDLINFIKGKNQLNATKLIDLIRGKKWQQHSNEILERSKEHFIGMFQFGSQHNYELDLKIFQQQNFLESLCQNKKMLFHPTIFTRQIFGVYQLSYLKNIYLEGQRGIGKSISLSLLTILHNYVQKLRDKVRDKAIFSNIKDQELIENQMKDMPKYFYLSLNMTNIQQKLKKQLPYSLLKRIQLAPVQSCDKFQSLLNMIQEYYWKKNIKIVIIVDHADQYLKQDHKVSLNKIKKLCQFQNLRKMIVSKWDFQSFISSDSQKFFSIDRKRFFCKKLEHRMMTYDNFASIVQFEIKKKSPSFKFLPNDEIYLVDQQKKNILFRITHAKVREIFERINFKQLQMNKLLSLFFNDVDILDKQPIYQVCQFNNKQIRQNTIFPAPLFSADNSYIIANAFIATKIIKKLASKQMSNEGNMDKQLITFIQNLQIPQDLQLSKKDQNLCKNIFYAIFSFNQKQFFPLNQHLFNQQRFSSAKLTNGGLVYHITKTTQQMFHHIFNVFESICIHGQSGIGKSISTSLFIVLYKFINDAFCNLSQDMISKLTFLPNRKKYLYYSLSKGSPLNINQFIKVLILQMPQLKILDNNINAKTLFQKMKNSYGNKPNIVIIIDQFNIYYSKLRQLIKNQRTNRNQVQNFSSFMSQMSKNFLLIFSSSQNIETNITSRINFRIGNFYQITQQNVRFVKINYQNRAIQYKGIKQIIEIIKFEMQNQLMKNKSRLIYTMRIIEKREWQFKMICSELQLNQQKFKKLFSKLSELTHQRIKLFFVTPLSHHLDRDLSLTKTNQKLENFLTLVNEMHDYAIRRQSLHYQQFLKKDINNVAMLLDIRRQAVRLSIRKNQDNKFSYQIQAKYIDEVLIHIFREHASIQNRMLTIYYSPQTYLKMTSFVWLNISFVNQVMINFLVNTNSDNHSWFGITMDNCLVQIFTQYCETLSFGGDIMYYVQKIANPYSHFQAFTKIARTQSSQTHDNREDYTFLESEQRSVIYVRFQDLFHSIFDNRSKLKDKYICAAPNTKYADQLKLDEYYSCNSQAIDFLLIKCTNLEIFDSFNTMFNQKPKMEATFKFQLHTFDFCVSFRQVVINRKIAKAEHFFKNFREIQNLENTKSGNKLVNQMIEKRNIDENLSRAYKHKNFKYQFTQIIHSIIIPKKLKEQLQKKKQLHNKWFHLRLIAFQDIDFQPRTDAQNLSTLNDLMALKKSLYNILATKSNS